MNTFRKRRTHAYRYCERILTIVASLFLVNAAQALDSTKALSQYVHDEWKADRGFLGGPVHAICQSADGYLWVGTERGLVRFDGSKFILIQRPIPNEPPIGPVRGLVADTAGNLWVRLDGPHLLRYRNGEFEDAVRRFSLQEVAFTAMSVNNNGELLVWGLQNGTLTYRNGKFQRLVTADTPGTVISIVETREHILWMGTRDSGLFRVDHQRLTKILRQRDAASVNQLIPAKSGGLWIGTDGGLDYWRGNSLTNTIVPSPISQTQILSLAEDHQGNLWVGTDHGLNRITQAHPLSVDLLKNTAGGEVSAIYEANNGDIWYGGPRGIERLRDGMFTTYSTSQGLPSQNNGPVYVDSAGTTWFAPLSGGLFSLANERVKQVVTAGLDKDVIYSIGGGGGSVWAGRQHGGLTVLFPGTKNYSPHTYTQVDGLAQNSVYSVHRNLDGTVWAGTVNAGVSELKDGKFTNYSTTNGLQSNTVTSIVEGYRGTIWFATANGLASFAHGRWQNLTSLDGLPSSDVRSIFEDSRHVLWIATTGGLAVLNAGRIEVPRNLPESLREQIFGIAEDKKGSLWITSSDHVLEVNRDRLLTGLLDDAKVQSYGIEDGLQGVEGVRRERSVIADSQGRIWIALNRGLAVVDPQVATSYSASERARIEPVLPSGVTGARNGPLKFSGSRSITLSYESTSLSTPERIRFRYKLDPSNQGWSETVSAGHVIYSDLSPGNYRFRILASSITGTWNGAETVLPFVVEPAYWQTGWFRALCVLALVMVFVIAYRLRMYQLTRQLNIRFQERLAERTHIAQELHDTLLQGFISASMQLDVAEDQLPDDSPAKPLLRRILTLMRQVNDEGRSTLRGLRTAEGDSQSLELAFSRMRQEFGIGSTIAYRVVVHSVARPLRPLIRDEVYRIGREAALNAFLHSRAKTIEVEIEYASKYLRLLVRDDGCGIDPEVLRAGRDGHWGLPGMRKRSESMAASLTLRSRAGAGTEVELTIPASVAFESESRGIFTRVLPWLAREEFRPTTNNSQKQEHP